jgi:hypothetical protein
MLGLISILVFGSQLAYSLDCYRSCQSNIEIGYVHLLPESYSGDLYLIRRYIATSFSKQLTAHRDGELLNPGKRLLKTQCVPQLLRHLCKAGLSVVRV